MYVPLTIADWIIIAVLLLSGVFAAWRGIVRETLDVAAFIAAAFASLSLGPLFAPLISENVTPMWLAQVATYGGIFVVVVIPLSFFSNGLSRGIGRSALGPLDHSLGFVYGVARGLVIVAIGYLVFTGMVTKRDEPEWLAQARLRDLVEATAEVILSVIPNRDAADAADAERPPARREAERPPAEKPPATDRTTQGAPAEQGSTDEGKTYTESETEGMDQLIRSTTEGEEPPPESAPKPTDSDDGTTP